MGSPDVPIPKLCSGVVPILAYESASVVAPAGVQADAEQQTVAHELGMQISMELESSSQSETKLGNRKPEL